MANLTPTKTLQREVENLTRFLDAANRQIASANGQIARLMTLLEKSNEENAKLTSHLREMNQRLVLQSKNSIKIMYMSFKD